MTIIRQSVKHLFNGTYQSNDAASGYQVLEYDLDKPLDRVRFIEDKVMNITSSIIFKNGYRKGENFISADHIVLDFDKIIIPRNNKTDTQWSRDTENKILEVLRDIMPSDILIYPSKSHFIKKDKDTEEAHPKFHVAIIFDKMIENPADYKRIFTYYLNRCEELKPDTAVRDLGRYIFPSYYSGLPLSSIVKERVNYLNDFLLTNDIITINTDLILNICRESELNDSKTFQNETSNIDLTDIEKNVKIMSAIDSLKGKNLDHMERWAIACFIKNTFGYDTMKNVILSIDNTSEGNKNIFDSLKKSNTKSDREYTVKSLIYIAEQHGWVRPLMTQKEIDMDYIRKLELEYVSKYDEIENGLDVIKEDKRIIEESNLTTIEKGKRLEKLEEDESKLNERKIELDKEKDNRIKNYYISKQDNTGRKFKTNIEYRNDNFMEYFNSFCGVDEYSQIVVEYEDKVRIYKKHEADLQFSNYIYRENNGKTIKEYSAFDRWLKNDQGLKRRNVKVVSKPNYKTNENEINTFRQTYTIKPNYNIDPAVIKIFDDIILHAQCGGDRELANYKWRFNASVVQYKKAGIGVQILGEQGTGKTFDFTLFNAIMGDDHTLLVANEEQIVGNFNSALDGNTFIFLDEGVEFKSRSGASQLKSLINGDMLVINPKGLKPYKIDNNITFMLASNDNLVVKIDKSDRRYLVLETDSKYQEKMNGKRNPLNRELFEPAFKIIGSKRSNFERDDEKLGMLLAYLLQMEVGDLFSDLPDTKRKEQVKQDSLSEFDNWIIQIYKDDGIIKDDRNDRYVDLKTCKYQVTNYVGDTFYNRIFTTTDLHELYNRVNHFHINQIVFGRKMSKFGKKIKVQEKWCTIIDLDMIKQNIGINIDLID